MIFLKFDWYELTLLLDRKSSTDYEAFYFSAVARA